MTGRSVLALWMLSLAACAFAAPDSPVGVWQTIDDKTGVARSEVRIIESGGVYEGRVEKLLNRRPDDDPDGLCRKCEAGGNEHQVFGL